MCFLAGPGRDRLNIAGTSFIFLYLENGWYLALARNVASLCMIPKNKFSVKNLFDNIMTYGFLAGPGRDRLNIAGTSFIFLYLENGWYLAVARNVASLFMIFKNKFYVKNLFDNIMTFGFLAGPGRDRLSFFIQFVRNVEIYFRKKTYYTE